MQETQRVIAINIEEELKTSFLDYSMSVIVSRALPDVRDGLKPVQRRILYAMAMLKNFHNRPYLKSARIVGDVIGKYHPHGDQPVYEALVRMAQEFSLRYPLIDGQGNFGSIDGDSAAAMRYTEIRLAHFAEFLISDIDKETVDFVPNYDNKEDEPKILPSRIPQLLVNGASGIAVGMATNIPPHNMREVLAGLEAYIEDPAITIEQLLGHIKGPDFPTHGIIHGTAGIREAYHTGRGMITIRSRAEIEDMPKQTGRQRIIITEIPYQINKARLIERIAELVNEKKLEGISDIRDESSSVGIRVVIDLKRGEPGEIILNNLFRQTQMQSSFGVNMVTLVKGAPMIINLKQLLEQFYLHRREVVLRRTAFELRKAEEKAHILLGLKTAVENIDEVVALIRRAKDSEEASLGLQATFKISEIQAKAILEMRLSRLTGLEREKVVAEYEETMKIAIDLRDILEKRERVTAIIRTELAELQEKFGDDRRTEIIPNDAEEFTMESLVADDEMAVSVTHAGYVKRTPTVSLRAQKRGGKGRKGMETKEEDVVRDLFIATNHQSLLCFTSAGKVYDIKVYQIPEAGWAAKGKHFANIISLGTDEKVVSVLPIKEFVQDHFVISVTSKGFVKKTDLMAYSNMRSSGIIGLKLDDGDTLISCAITTGKSEILVATKLGKAIRFAEEECRPMGRASRGVTGIRFSEEQDVVIGMEVLQAEGSVLSVCENGYGKRSPLDEYRIQSRGGKGIYTIKVTERNGPVVGIVQVQDTDHLMVMTSAGKVMRFTVAEIGIIGRLTQGVRLINVEEGEKIIGVAKIMMFEGEEV